MCLGNKGVPLFARRKVDDRQRPVDTNGRVQAVQRGFVFGGVGRGDGVDEVDVCRQRLEAMGEAARHQKANGRFRR